MITYYYILYKLHLFIIYYINILYYIMCMLLVLLLSRFSSVQLCVTP